MIEFMGQYIDKSALVAEINRLIKKNELYLDESASDEVRFQKTGAYSVLCDLRHFLNTLEVIDPYEQCVQYSSIEDGIKAHAEIYSFNIESELFNQLTKEQQALWRKEIEQAYIIGGNTGVELARDTRYKENFKVKDVDLEKEIDKEIETRWRGEYLFTSKFCESARHFFELGLKAQKE